MNKIVRSNISDIRKLLAESNNGLRAFRYFNKRNLEITHSHLISIIMLRNNHPVAYGHIEEDSEKFWLGLLVGDQYTNQGIGSMMMKALIDASFALYVKTIHLTVDTDNAHAIQLYTKFDFLIINSTHNYHLMRRANR